MHTSTLSLTAPAQVYRRRRAALAATLHRPFVIFAGHAPARNYPANAHPFRPGSTYTYYGGPPLEHAALLMEPGSDGDAGCTLFRPTWGVDEAVWVGEATPDQALADATGLSVERLADPDELEARLAKRAIAAITPPFPETLARVSRLGLHEPEPTELLAIVDQRLCKDEYELDAMRRAAAVGIAAQRAVAAATFPGGREAEAAAAFTAVLTGNECQPSFTPIVTVRGEVFHGVGHPNRLTDGALLLVDAGAEEPGGYASDMTRTYPVSGTWTAMQRQLYDTVLRALNAAVAACVPGRRYRDVHDLAAAIICEGLVTAELLRGDPADLAARRAHALFFPHGVGHLIGLDVHDMEDFGDIAGYAPGRTRRTNFGDKFLRLDRDLLPGMCVTIEPGVYIVPAIWECAELVKPLADAVNRPAVEALVAAQFGGIRIEHTVCVRDALGPEVLTAQLPTDADEVAALVGAH